MSAQYDQDKDNWWLTVGGSTAGNIHRSLTNKLLHDRWFACQVLENAKIATGVRGQVWQPVDVILWKNGEPQSEDVI